MAITLLLMEWLLDVTISIRLEKVFGQIQTLNGSIMMSTTTQYPLKSPTRVFLIYLDL